MVKTLEEQHIPDVKKRGSSFFLCWLNALTLQGSSVAVEDKEYEALRSLKKRSNSRLKVRLQSRAISNTSLGKLSFRFREKSLETSTQNSF